MSSLLGLFGDFNDANLLFLGGAPGWVIALLAVVAVGLLVLTWVDLRELRGRRRGTLVVLRALALGLALLVVMEPALELRHVTRIKNHVVFLVDTSQSMVLPHEGERSRWDAAMAFVEAARERIEGVDADHIYEIVAFDGETRATSIAELQAAGAPAGASTHLLEALEEVAERYPRADLGGVVIVTDGTDSGALSGRVQPGDPLDAETARFVESLGVPVHTMALGDPERVRDLAIERVLVDDFAFVRNRVAVDVVVRAIGTGRQLIPVTLRRNGEVLQVRELSLGEDEDEYRVRFEFIPEQIGKEIYSVSLPVLAQELLPENNQAYFVLKVIRDKIRVLQVCGRPSWDERFLRELLKRNPNVDLISFFILRTDASLQSVPANELSLIPFPTEELFDEQLPSFDLVIFQNFNYQPHGMYRYLAGIADYVRGGGAFVMIGGDQSFASGGYSGTPVGDILPVALPPSGSESMIIDLERFRPVLTEAGMNHPITALEFSAAENRERWGSLPELHGSNLVQAARPGSTVLLTHPALRAGEAPMPVLTVGELGEGRTMAFTSDSSWLWSFEGVRDGGTSRPYTSFWNSAIRWLIRDPELKLIQVETPQQHVAPGEPFEVVVQVLLPDYSPAVGLEGSWDLRRTPLDRLGERDAEEVIREERFTTDERGRLRLDLQVDEPAAYSLTARADIPGAGVVTDSDLFLALRETRELRDILPRPELLAALSAASEGGRHGDDLDPDSLSFAPARTVQVDRRNIVHVWNTPWLLGVLALMLAVEWSMRRRWGRA